MGNPEFVFERGTISFYLNGAPETLPIVFSESEEAAIKIIFAVLSQNNIDVSTITFDRTKEYLKLTGEKYYAFCNLKLSGKTRYMELTISGKDAKTLKDDPRFSAYPIAQKRFSRIPVESAADIASFQDVILLAYQWATISAKK